MGIARLSSKLSGVVFVCFALSACDSPSAPEGITQATGGGESGSGASGGASGTGGGGGGPGSGGVGGATASPVIVSVRANPAIAEGMSTSLALENQAQVKAFAAGARGVVISKRWSELELEGLADTLAFYDGLAKRAVFRLVVVDRAFDARPSGLVGAGWNSPAVLGQIDATIDAIAEQSGSSLWGFEIGYEADAFVQSQPNSAAAFEAFSEHVLARVAAWPQPPQYIGVSVRASTVLDGAPGSELSELGSAHFTTYFPGGDDFRVAEPSPIPVVLDQLIERAGDRPILLSGVGFPTDGGTLNGARAQRVFFASLFDAVSSRRASFPMVHVRDLSDLSLTACDVWATEQGFDIDGPQARYECSLGLFDTLGEPKPSWEEFWVGAASFATP